MTRQAPVPGGQERSENDFTSHQGSKRYPEMKPPSDLPETGYYPGHPVCGGSSLLAAWVALGGSRRFHGSFVSALSFPEGRGTIQSLNPIFPPPPQEEQIEAEASLKQKGNNVLPSPRVLTWEKLELLDNIRCLYAIVAPGARNRGSSTS